MLPELNRIYKNTTQIDVFRGLNRTVNTGFSRVSSNSSAIYTEFSDMKNLCGDVFPQLSTRKKRSRLSRESAGAIVSNVIVVNGKLVWVESSGKLHYDGTEHTIRGYIAGEHTLTQYGNNIIVMPEKKYFDLGKEEFEDIEVTFTLENLGSSNRNITNSTLISSCSIEKVDIDDYGKPRKTKFKVLSGLDLTDENHQRPIDGMGNFGNQQMFTNTAEGDVVEAMTSSPSGLYKCYSVSSNQDFNTDQKLRSFVRVNDYYVRIYTVSKSDTTKLKKLKKGDYIKFSDMEDYKNIQYPVVDDERVLEEITYDGYIKIMNENTFKVYDVYVAPSMEGSDRLEGWILIKVNLECSIPYAGNLTIERVMPPGLDDDKLIEVNNRLWGCSSSQNEIYSCKQGDCTNWQAYSDGISTDSFAATIGCEGDFTAIARQNDSVIFFKENWIIKLYGTKPSNYTTAVFNVPGVEKGSGRSVTWVNGVLFYLSPSGVCRYSPGGQPVIISEEAFGNRKYKNGVGGRHRDKYVLSAQNENGEYEMFTFDTKSGMWHKEDNTRMKSCATYNNILYYIDGTTGDLMCMEAENNLLSDSESFETEGDFEWMCETGNLYDNDFNAKYISKIQIMADISEGASFEVLAQFRDRGEWWSLRELRSEITRPRRVDIAMRRSDHLRLRFSGKGACRISGVLIEYGRGSGIK